MAKNFSWACVEMRMKLNVMFLVNPETEFFRLLIIHSDENFVCSSLNLMFIVMESVLNNF